MRTSMAKIVVGAILLITGAAGFATLAWRYRHIPHFGRFDDDAVYLVCAKSLAEGRGYRIASLPGEPAETKFPPLFPAMLATIWRWNPQFPDNLTLISPLLWLMVPALWAVSYALFRSLSFSPGGALALTGLMALNPFVAIFGVSVLSELLFMVLALGSMVLVQAAPGRWRMAALAGLLGGAAYLSRTAAILLLAAVPAWLALRREYRSAIAYAAAMLPAVAVWNWWCAANRVRTSDPTLLFHTDYFGQYLRWAATADWPETISLNVAELISNVERLVLFYLDDRVITAYGSYVLGIALVVGTAAMLWSMRKMTPLGAFAALYCAILLGWNYPPNDRFVLPLLPLALAGAAWTVRRFAGEVARASPPAVRKMAPSIAVALCLPVAAMNSWVLMRTLPATLDEYAKQLSDARPAYAWAVRSTPPGTRFYAYNDALFWLYTGRQAATPHPVNQSANVEKRGPIEAVFANIPQWARPWHLSYGVVTAADFSRDLTEEQSARAAAAIARGSTRVHSFPNSAVIQFQLP